MQTIERDAVIADLKRKIVKIAAKHRLGHVPSCFSCLDILYTLYSKIVNIKPDNVLSIDRDKVIVSKEHCKLGLLCVLEHFNLIPEGAADEWFYNGSKIGHDIFKEVSIDKYAAVDVSYGTLGQGLGVGAGIAYANPHNVYIIVGDGEMQEGSCWEALMFIKQYNLKNITVIIDRNWIQGSGYTKDIIDSSSRLVQQITSFGFDVIECNGHSLDELENAFKQQTQNPKCIVANTIKGKECLFLAEKKDYIYLHNAIWTDEEYAKIAEDVK